MAITLSHTRTVLVDSSAIGPLTEILLCIVEDFVNHFVRNKKYHTTMLDEANMAMIEGQS